MADNQEPSTSTQGQEPSTSVEPKKTLTSTERTKAFRLRRKAEGKSIYGKLNWPVRSQNMITFDQLLDVYRREPSKVIQYVVYDRAIMVELYTHCQVFCMCTCFADDVSKKHYHMLIYDPLDSVYHRKQLTTIDGITSTRKYKVVGTKINCEDHLVNVCHYLLCPHEILPHARFQGEVHQHSDHRSHIVGMNHGIVVKRKGFVPFKYQPCKDFKSQWKTNTRPCVVDCPCKESKKWWGQEKKVGFKKTPFVGPTLADCIEYGKPQCVLSKGRKRPSELRAELEAKIAKVSEVTHF